MTLTFQRFRRKPTTTSARRLTERTEIMTPNGPVIGNPGDWYVIDTDGNPYPCVDSVFRSVFDPVDEHGNSYSWDGFDKENA